MFVVAVNVATSCGSAFYATTLLTPAPDFDCLVNTVRSVPEVSRVGKPDRRHGSESVVLELANNPADTPPVMMARHIRHRMPVDTVLLTIFWGGRHEPPRTAVQTSAIQIHRIADELRTRCAPSSSGVVACTYLGDSIPC
jgi:hypothetical protein